MPWRVFDKDSVTSWVPSDDGIADGTDARVDLCGSGGNGAAGDVDNFGGGGGGGGEYRWAEFTIADASLTYTLAVDEPGNVGFTSFVQGMSVIAKAYSGGNGIGMSTGGAGGSGGTGDGGGNGGNGGASQVNIAGGGGGSCGGLDGNGHAGSDGSNPSGGAGGTTAQPFYLSNGGQGGNGADGYSAGSSAGQDGFAFGGGGGGSTTSTPSTGGEALVVVAWGPSIGSFPPVLEAGFYDDPPAAEYLWRALPILGVPNFGAPEHQIPSIVEIIATTLSNWWRLIF